MNRALPQALSEDEIDRLVARLADFPGALSLESVDGLFCALIAAPGLTIPSDYLPVILDSTSPESGAFRDEADAQDTIGLLMRYWNSVDSPSWRRCVPFDRRNRCESNSARPFLCHSDWHYRIHPWKNNFPRANLRQFLPRWPTRRKD